LTPTTFSEIQNRVRREADAQTALGLRRFFKAGPGQYAENDAFLGIRVPDLRRLANSFSHVPTSVFPRLLASPYHEERMLALLLMIRRFECSDGKIQENMFRLYLAHTDRINSWDLVDVSSPAIVGAYLHDRDKAPVYELARSLRLWDRRISIVSTFHDIRRGHFDTALTVSERLLADAEDLIHKAVGWMLREIGKRDASLLESFLARHYRKMPRTMLRYAIEKLSQDRRKAYLAGKV
jgi:3-methyladenine DNA glycosylase AlkD